MTDLSRLEEITDLRTVWPHEAIDFTPWLSQEDNISLLVDAIGIVTKLTYETVKYSNFAVVKLPINY